MLIWLLIGGHREHPLPLVGVAMPPTTVVVVMVVVVGVWLLVIGLHGNLLLHGLLEGVMWRLLHGQGLLEVWVWLVLGGGDGAGYGGPAQHVTMRGVHGPQGAWPAQGVGLLGGMSVLLPLGEWQCGGGVVSTLRLGLWLRLEE